MKMMDITMQDDCTIEVVTPAKKKKMKQARLPFQMLSSLDSPNSISNKKRKLTSPLIECKSPKVVKITTKENSIEEAEDSKANSEINSTINGSDTSIEIVKESEIEIEEESTVSSKTKGTSTKVTPKRKSVGKKRKLEKTVKGRRNRLSKFLEKTDSETETVEDNNCSLQEEKADDPCNESTSTKSAEISMLSEDESSNKSKDAALAGNDSICVNSDSDIAILSSENEEKDEHIKSDETITKEAKIKSPKTPKTPKARKSMDTAKEKKLTPKQQEKKIQSAKKKEEKERLRMEKEKKLEEERENRRKEKEEKRKEKEEKEKAEREKKLEERKLKELKKQMEIEQKQKEKEAKEEERRKKEEAKEEEKRKKEEEKLEAERKKQKAASNFASFFVAKKQESKSVEEENIIEAKNFMPFEVKADMKVAPVCRRVLNEDEKSSFDEKHSTGNTKKSNLYLSELKNKKYIPRKSTKTWPLESKDEDIVLIDEENDGSSNIVEQTDVGEKHRPKLLQFTENRRPPYWGTWRKCSDNINPRRPFSRDAKWFNYEVDSDEEWEEEEPGESLRGSDDEKDEENPEDNEYDVDNEFMVPHGYLSDEEAQADEEDKEDMSPETQKFKLKVLGEEFESERNTKTSKLKPKIIGCIWQGPENTFSENVSPKAADFLSARQAWVRQIPVTLPSVYENEATVPGECGTPTQKQAPTSTKKTKVPVEALPDLIRLVHGNTHGRGFLVKEFMTYWNKKNKVGENQISKASLLQKIREIGRWMACPEEGPMHLKACWYVSEDTRKEHLPADEELTLPNRWSYTLTPKRKSDFVEAIDKPEKEEKDKEKKNVPLITQFTKKITQEEMKKQLTVKPAESSIGSPKTAQQKAPKRATLISVGRGEQFSKASRESLFTGFGGNEKPGDKEADEKKDDEDIIFVETIKKDSIDNRLKINSPSTNSSQKKSVVPSPSTKNKKKKMSGGKKTKVSDLINNSPKNKGTQKTLDVPMDVDD